MRLDGHLRKLYKHTDTYLRAVSSMCEASRVLSDDFKEVSAAPHAATRSARCAHSTMPFTHTVHTPSVRRRSRPTLGCRPRRTSSHRPTTRCSPSSCSCWASCSTSRSSSPSAARSKDARTSTSGSPTARRCGSTTMRTGASRWGRFRRIRPTRRRTSRTSRMRAKPTPSTRRWSRPTSRPSPGRPPPSRGLHGACRVAGGVLRDGVVVLASAAGRQQAFASSASTAAGWRSVRDVTA